MAKNDIFKMSPEGKSEYCCNVVRIDEIKPIEGADAIGQVFVNVSESLVVRKDQVKPGDLLFYAENETELNPGFLAANNLFDISCYEMNSNAEEWRENMEKAEALKASVKTGKDKIKKLKKFVQDYVKGDDEKKRKVLARVAKLLEVDAVVGGEVIGDSIKLIEKANDAAVMEADRLRAEVKKHTGFFNKYGRVKMLRLKGTPSIGYLFTLDELIRWKPELADEEIDMEALINQDFDTIGDELFVKAYVPRIKERKHTPRTGNKAQKKLQKFDRLIPGTFEFHYDTDPLGKNMWKVNPDDVVDISVKCHGTSLIVSNLPLRNPIKLPLWKKVWNCIAKLLRLPEEKRYIDYVVENDVLYSSRKVIKNKDVNLEVGSGYYSRDVWSDYGKLIAPCLSNNMTVYAEICGYVNEEKMIQKNYDYGCEPGEAFVMPYRITSENTDGTRHEWEISDVVAWTRHKLQEHPELDGVLKPLVLLYHGTLRNLYPDLDTTEHWHENVYQRLANEPKFGMEDLEPLCKNEVPREGFVLRIEGDKTAEAFKCKCLNFRELERSSVDNNEVDIEMADAYSAELEAAAESEETA